MELHVTVALLFSQVCYVITQTHVQTQTRFHPATLLETIAFKNWHSDPLGWTLHAREALADSIFQ